MGLEVGELFEGKYRIVRLLGEGGMGTVYEGAHTRIHRRVAIKVLKAEVAQDREMVERFEREAQAASRIGSRHVVEVHDVGELATGERFIILEHLQGESLSRRLKKRGRMLPEEAFPLAIQLLEGLAAAHHAGIVHRDLKPANVYICDDRGSDLVKILDFGVSKFRSVDTDGMTHTGTIIGTPHYMAPEQTRGARDVDHRADLYAVGAILFRALSGRTPFLVETIHELIAALITEEAPELQTVVPGVDAHAAAIVDRALLRDPQKRFQTAEELAAALQDWVARRHARPAQRPLAPLDTTQLVDPHTDPWPTPHSLSLRTPPASSHDTAPMNAPPPVPTIPGSPVHAPRVVESMTPSPSLLEPATDVGRRRVGAIVVGAVMLVAAVASVGLLLSTGDESSAEDSPVPASTDPGSDSHETAPAASEPASEEPAPGASASSSARATASASVKGAPPPRSAPKPAKPAASGEAREFRTDLE